MADAKELLFERTYDSPIETVWRSWTDPNILKQWWGPKGINVPQCEIDLRIGGRIYLVMEAPNTKAPEKSMRWPMEGTFTLIEPVTNLSYTAKAWTEGQEDSSSIEQLAELVLTDDNGKTKMNFKVTIYKSGLKASLAVFGIKMSYKQQFEELDKFLKR